MRIAADRRRQSGRDEIKGMIAAGSGQVDRFGSPIEVRTWRDELVTVGLAQQGPHHVATRIQVSRDDHQLAKPGLPEVVGEHISIATADPRPPRTGRVRGATYQTPQRTREDLVSGIRVERRTQEPPPPGASGRSTASGPTLRIRGTSREHEQQHDRHRNRGR